VCVCMGDVCICMYACIYICVCVYEYVRAYVPVSLFFSYTKRTHIHAYTHTHTQICVLGGVDVIASGLNSESAQIRKYSINILAKLAITVQGQV